MMNNNVLENSKKVGKRTGKYIGKLTIIGAVAVLQGMALKFVKDAGKI